MSRLTILVGLALAGCLPQGAAAPSPSPRTSDLVWLWDAPRLVSMDWSGRRGATVSAQGFVIPSADGARLLRSVADATEVEDSTGRSLGRLDFPGHPAGLMTWADDSRHVCAVAFPPAAGPDTGQGSLWVGALGEAARKVGTIGKPGSDPSLAACSMTSDRAVIVGDLGAHWPPGATKYLITATVEVVKLSTGAIEYERNYPLGNLGGQRESGPRGDWVFVVASPDGRYLAESAVFSATTTIRELPSGNQVATLPGLDALGFSWDGARVAAEAGHGYASEVRLVAWADQHVPWHGPAVGQWMVARPNSTDVMVGLVDPQGGLNELVRVSAQGISTVLARNVLVDVPCPCPGAGAA